VALTITDPGHIALRKGMKAESDWALAKRGELDAAIQKHCWDGEWFIWAIGQDGISAGLTLLGYFGLIIATIRSLAALFQPNESNQWSRTETWPQTILLLFGCSILFLIGMFPQFFLSSSSLLFP